MLPKRLSTHQQLLISVSALIEITIIVHKLLEFNYRSTQIFDPEKIDKF